MPRAFEDCVKNNGRVRTKKLSGGRYIKICFIGSKSYAGETHTKQKKSTREWVDNQLSRK